MTVVTDRPALRRIQRVMGTVVSYCVSPGGPGSEGALLLGLARARTEMERADQIFSTWKPNSPMSLVRRGELAVEDAPAVVAEVLERCGEARRRSGGWFDPWALPGGVDPTGLVKGWAAQRALACIQRAGAESAMVNAGGDIAVFGRPAPERPWRVGIRHPSDATRLLAVVTAESAVATSGVYERGAHVLSPRTGAPAGGVVSATVLGADLDLADALATGLVAAGPQVGDALDALSDTGYEAVVVDAAGALLATSACPLES